MKNSNLFLKESLSKKATGVFVSFLIGLSPIISFSAEGNQEFDQNQNMTVESKSKNKRHGIRFLKIGLPIIGALGVSGITTGVVIYKFCKHNQIERLKENFKIFYMQASKLKDSCSAIENVQKTIGKGLLFGDWYNEYNANLWGKEGKLSLFFQEKSNSYLENLNSVLEDEIFKLDYGNIRKLYHSSKRVEKW